MTDALLWPSSTCPQLSGPSADAAEDQVLSLVPNLHCLPEHCCNSLMKVRDCTGAASHADGGVMGPDGTRRWQKSYVRLPGENRTIRELHIWSDKVSNAADKLSCVRCNLVMLHGYGGGLGLFYKNFEAISSRSGWHLYALDLLGMGLSSRPQFCLKAPSRQGRTNEAENWFVDALEDWRNARGSMEWYC